MRYSQLKEANIKTLNSSNNSQENITSSVTSNVTCPGSVLFCRIRPHNIVVTKLKKIVKQNIGAWWLIFVQFFKKLIENLIGSGYELKQFCPRVRIWVIIIQNRNTIKKVGQKGTFFLLEKHRPSCHSCACDVIVRCRNFTKICNPPWAPAWASFSLSPSGLSPQFLFYFLHTTFYSRRRDRLPTKSFPS